MLRKIITRALMPGRHLFLIAAVLGMPSLGAAAAGQPGVGERQTGIAFSSQNVTTRVMPTQLEFGPDGRLYVAELKGGIYAYAVERNDETGVYSIAATELINLIQTIPNHNDDGTPFASNQRNVTGMITAGTPENPVLFVSSSDPRLDDPQADTNSGVVSRLTWTGSEWTKLDLVRSLPRSEHDHLPNGMALDAASGILYLAQGGHTNMGAPSALFGFLREYALSAAILSIDLNAIGEQTYDIPTLKGEVFGGQRGKNQAMLVAGGPVQIHSPGYRNAYDVLLTAAGRLYTYDNDSNSGWGGLVVGEGPGGTCTNETNELNSATHFDNFHLIAGPGYYGGHPNPTRANRSNTFDGLSPIPEGLENPVECQFLIPGVEDGAIALNDASTNGLTEYTAGNFGGQMTGNIIATTYDGNVLRLILNSDGDQVIEQTKLFTGLSGPLGVTAQGDSDPFPGTIWIGQLFSDQITVFEPQDFFECDPDSLDPDATSPNGFTYGDLIDNGLDPCNPAQVPPDFDQDFVSDLNDPDIDGDGIANQNDRFDFDASNGRGNPLPHRLAWGSEVIATLGGMTAHNAPGFTGLMAHPFSPVSVFEQFNPDRLIPGGAAGIFTIEQVTAGDAQLNTQENAFHFGVDVHAGSPVFTAQARIMAPFAGSTPQAEQSMGLVIGRGDQNNYIKLVTHANGGAGGIEFAGEIQGVYDAGRFSADILGADYVDLYLVVDPATASVKASYVIVRDAVRGQRTPAGQSIAMPPGWVSDPINGLAVGIIATSGGAEPFSASWRFIEVYEGTGDDFPIPGGGQLEADPPALTFPATQVGDTAVLAVTLSNTGDAALEIDNAVVSVDQVFVPDLVLPLTLEPGAGHSFSVIFTPDVATSFETVLILSHDGGNSPLPIQLSGQGSQPGMLEFELQISAAPDPAVAGIPLTYSLLARNLSDALADDVSLTISVPSDTNFLSSQGCEQDPLGHPVCLIGLIPAGGSGEVSVSVEVPASATGPLQLSATLSAPDLSQAVTAGLVTALTSVTDLALVMTGAAVPIDARILALEYLIVVSNAGPSDAASALVMTDLAPGLDNVQWTCQADANASCTGSGEGEIDDLADIPAGASVTYLIEATVALALIEEGLSSSAEVAPSGEATDPDLGNNSDSFTISDRLFQDRFEANED